MPLAPLSVLTSQATAQPAKANLERQQDIAVVGETVPLIFCERNDWGGHYGENGGIWLSPRLIQLGIKVKQTFNDVHVSQGKITGSVATKRFGVITSWLMLTERNDVCLLMSRCLHNLDLDYDPGGLSWTTGLPGGSLPLAQGQFYVCQ